MKRLLTALICFAVAVTTATAEVALQYSKPLQGLEAASVSSVILRTKDKSAEIKISDKEWTRTLLATISDQDFPLWKGPVGFSLPGELCSVEFRDGRGKALRVVTVLCAWNLLSVGNEGTSELGSNRRFAEAVIRKLEETQTDYIQKQRETYGNHLSGSYEKEYRDIIKSEQAREESELKIRLFAERKGNAVQFTIDLPTFPQWVSYGPDFYFENFFDAVVIGTDFDMPLITFGYATSDHEKITFKLPKSILKDLSLHLTYDVTYNTNAPTAAIRAGKRGAAIATARTRHIPNALTSSRDVRFMMFTLNAPDKDGANEIKPEQQGVGRPATKPAGKPPVKDQPSTPTSKDVPR